MTTRPPPCPAPPDRRGTACRYGAGGAALLLAAALAGLASLAALAALAGCTRDQPYDFDGDGTSDDRDCAPEDPAIHPGVPEDCADGVDNDCDGQVDCGDGDDDTVSDDDTGGDDDSATAEDGDGDGWDAGEDCDDSDATVHPEALEACEDEVDADCDGFDPPCPPLGDLAGEDSAVVLVQGDIDNSVASLAVGDLDGDGIADLALGDPVSVRGADTAGAVYLHRGPLTDGAVFDGGRVLTEDAAGRRCGGAVVIGGDLTGDGNADLVVGCGADEADPGRVYIVSGIPASDGSLDEAAAATVTGIGNGDQAGTGVASSGDVNGDGAADLVVGSPGGDATGTDSGTVYLVAGPLSGTVDLFGGADATWTGAEAGHHSGSQLALGDFADDGYADLVVATTDGSDLGPVFVVPGQGSWGSPESLATAAGTTFRTASPSGLGIGAVTVEDFTGDGLPDLLLGVPSFDFAGGVYVVAGPLPAGEVDPGAVAVAWVGAGNDAGWSSAAACDLDSDGQRDLVTTGRAVPSGEPSAWLLYGPLSAGGDLADADATFSASGVGADLAGCGDLTGDGLGDLALMLGLPGEAGPSLIVLPGGWGG